MTTAVERKTTPETGDILVAHWGYEASLYDFYEVLKVTAKTVQLVELADELVALPDGRRTRRPIVGKHKGEPFTRKFTVEEARSVSGYSVRIHTYKYAYNVYDRYAQYINEVWH